MLSRPRPSESLRAPAADPCFEPAHDLYEWVTKVLLEEEGPLHNPDHVHLRVAQVGFLWTNVANGRGGKAIIGQTEFRPPGGTMGKWARARAEAQLVAWFARPLDFLITLDAGYCAEASDAQFLALLEHELYHCGQAQDVFGAPKFSKNSGLPVFALRAHDVEEFTGVVRRYGVVTDDVAELAAALQGESMMSSDRLSGVCGTCGSSSRLHNAA